MRTAAHNFMFLAKELQSNVKVTEKAKRLRDLIITALSKADGHHRVAHRLERRERRQEEPYSELFKYYDQLGEYEALSLDLDGIWGEARRWALVQGPQVTTQGLLVAPDSVERETLSDVSLSPASNKRAWSGVSKMDPPGISRFRFWAQACMRGRVNLARRKFNAI